MQKEFTLITDELGEWEVLYYNGKKILDGHSIRLDEFFEFLINEKIIDKVSHQTINNQKYNYEYHDDNPNPEPEFHEFLKDYGRDDFT